MTFAQGMKDEIKKLSVVDIDALRKNWKDLYGFEPLSRISREMLIKAVAYKQMEKRYGGLKPSTVRHLAQMADDLKAGKNIVSSTGFKAKSGTKLVRLS